MKRTIRVLIPLLLAVAILFCICWYLMVYDRAFTRDFLLQQARSAEASGNHTIATWFYNQAYRQTGDKDTIAVELANQYKRIGNYTKAETTLSRAIADGAGVDVYVALCRTYVEQGKLLDAVTMLDQVSNPGIKSMLDKMRPAKPVSSPEPGFYNQYISASITSETGKLYAALGGQYPSVKKDLYTGPITLAQGENTIYAIAVDENGLVSPLAIFGYTIGGIIEKVQFTDPVMETTIRTLLNVSSGKDIYTNELWEIKEFTVPAGVNSYADLKYLPFLESLTIENGPSVSLSVISAISNLKTLRIEKTALPADAISAIAILPKLESLTLKNCQLSSIAGLETLTTLTYLDLSNNTIRNIDALAMLQNLQTLYLHHNALIDLSPLTSLVKLTTLDVSYNSVGSLRPLENLGALTWLNLDSNGLTGLGGLGKLTGLTHLSLAYNGISNISELSACQKLVELNISNNILNNIDTISGLPVLQRLDFSYNKVSKLPTLKSTCKLVYINGTYNKLSSLEPLRGLQYLNEVHMDYNSNISSVACLAQCRVLVLVNVYGTKVKDVSSLTNLGILVNYRPS